MLQLLFCWLNGFEKLGTEERKVAFIYHFNNKLLFNHVEKSIV